MAVNMILWLSRKNEKERIVGRAIVIVSIIPSTLVLC